MSGRCQLRAVIRGDVQGVGFRWHAQRVASGLDLDGWVANRADGSVEVLAEGPQTALDTLLATLREGPPSGNVTEIETSWSAATGVASGFAIRSGSHPGD